MKRRETITKVRLIRTAESKKKKTFIFNELKGEQINQNMTTMRSDFVTNAQTRTKRKNIMRENEIFFIIFLLSNEK